MTSQRCQLQVYVITISGILLRKSVVVTVAVVAGWIVFQVDTAVDGRISERVCLCVGLWLRILSAF